MGNAFRCRAWKDIVGMVDGQTIERARQSWKELLLDLKRRGFGTGPDRWPTYALKFSATAPWASGRRSRRGLRRDHGAASCLSLGWVHFKTANEVLNQMPKSLQAKAKDTHAQTSCTTSGWPRLGPTRLAQEAAFDFFIGRHGTCSLDASAKYHSQAAERLVRRAKIDRDFRRPWRRTTHCWTTKPGKSVELGRGVYFSPRI